MKIVTVVGARPQFVKAAAFSRVVRAQHTEILVHTGQHYDSQMSDVFFDELMLPKPDYHLGVGSGSHGAQTAQMLERIETVMRSEAPDAAVIYGDTNSTLAGALAAAKLAIPIGHVEAGLRSFVRDMPEEINRLVADRVSTYLFAPTATAVENLLREGYRLARGDSSADQREVGRPTLDAGSAGVDEGARPRAGDDDHRGGTPGGIYRTGDIMYDALLQHAPVAEAKSTMLHRLMLSPGQYVLATVHRAANTDDPRKLAEIFDALALLREPVIVPLHPRTKAVLMGTDIEIEAPVRIIEPAGYLDMLALERGARIVLTDSGGVQKEAYLLGVPCVTLRDETEWIETLEGGWNVLAGADAERIVAAAQRARPAGTPPPVFGDGHAAERMVAALEAAVATA